MPMLILNVAWMREYKGIKGSMRDVPIGKFGYMKDGGTPHEIFNFLPARGRCYGYAPVQAGKVNIQRLGARPDAKSVDDVTVIWTATHPDGGRFIVGWYTGARVYAEQQKRRGGKETAVLRGGLYVTEAPAEKCHLLPLDERVFAVPKMQHGFPGISPAFFPEGKSPARWVDEIKKYVATGHKQKAPPAKSNGRKIVDPEHRKLVEEAAVRRVTAHYEKLGYQVRSQERENVGWDLEATQGALLLKLEVKGLSGKESIVELTPNEYAAMLHRFHKSSYRVCIVTDALAKKAAALKIFSFDKLLDAWVSDGDELLSIKKMIAAHLSVI